MFCGTPDTVARQIRELRQRVGGLGQLIVGTHWGLVTHEEAMRSYRLFAAEVMPQLEDLEPLEQPLLASVAA
jgi:alkanesulfonate monooxygenase SsuD/methylene tetrahydromethanopterin reductase-like flavin-dependent oxidoreductase (luciferase family)